MPTGMEKEEESEKHLQDILVKVKILPFINLVSSSFYVYDNNMKHWIQERNGADDLYIPTPEAFSLDVNNQYKKMYKSGFKVNFIINSKFHFLTWQN